jgi:hypothetical protein
MVGPTTAEAIRSASGPFRDVETGSVVAHGGVAFRANPFSGRMRHGPGQRGAALGLVAPHPAM